MRRYDDELEFDESLEIEDERKKYVVIGVVAVVLIFLVIWFIRGETKENSVVADNTSATNSEISSVQVEGENSLNNNQNGNVEQEGASVEENIETEATIEETEKILISDRVIEIPVITNGIDVAKYQGMIDWKKVAESGIDFAMIRVGYRTMESGDIKEDEMARYNMQEAAANGIKIGVYFFSTAITEGEARREAEWVADFIEGYPITYPVAYDCEGFNKQTNRHYALTKEERTELAMVFMDRIYELGYTPMFYGAKNELTDDLKWETSILDKRYKIWVSQYADIEKTDYAGAFCMWQRSCTGSVSGISGDVDLNVAYFGYENAADPMGEPAAKVTVSVADTMDFIETDEIVTAKNMTNLRDVPSQGEDSTVKVKLSNGERAARIGISKTGWSKLLYQGEVYYAVSSYLTTDLAVAEPEPPKTDDGIKTEFIKCDEMVTAKIEVNLRRLPSVTNPEAHVVATLYNGEYIKRIGVNHEVGWSKVEYNGQILYCVSSYLEIAQ